MRKINDFFGAGVIFGFIINLFLSIPTFAMIRLGLSIRPPWSDLAILFFKPPQAYSFSAQIFGYFATFGVAIANGIIIGGLFKFTGRDFAYIKSIVVCTFNVMFAFMILYPSLGLKADQHSLLTTYFAFISNQPFAILVAYLFLRFTTVGLTEPKNETKEIPHANIRFVPVPAKKQGLKERKIRLVKPKKL